MTEPPGERGGPPRNGTASHQTAADQSRFDLTSKREIDVESLAGMPEHLAIAYGAIWLTAERGLPAPSDVELLGMTGLESFSSPNKIFRQLCRRGLLAWHSFQRGRQVYVHALGKSTAAPPCRVARWRHQGTRNG